ncbi:MAG TPA: TPM domain-containing protein [Nitrospiraceae bacterium]|nr:TPM domain-containing protein [Nitrospiraceae bacterium]
MTWFDTHLPLGDLFRTLVLIGLLLPQTVEGSSQDRRPLPEPLGYVSDHGGGVDPDWKARIRSVCQDLERKTGVEMVVVTVKALAPYQTAQEYASAIYQQWGVGTAQKDHGVLILAVLEDRQAAVSVGRGVMATVTPQVIEDVGRQYIQPAFRTSHYGEGLYRATVSLASLMQDIRVGDPPRSHMKGVGIFLTLFTGAGALAFLWWISRPDLRHPFQRLHRNEFWGSGQGGFGGNFGGFGGGTSGEGLS